MRVIGVLDLIAGRAVHARSGRRETYVPVHAAAGMTFDSGDALQLGQLYLERLGLTELYAADLDAILARVRDPSASPDATGRTQSGSTSQDSLIASLAGLPAPLWLDAGVSCVDQARHALDVGATRVVVGLETLPSYEALGEICDAVHGDCVAFSLDVRDGEPVIATGTPREIQHGEPPSVIAARAADAGVSAVILLDLARVGTEAGLDLELIARVRKAAPEVTLLAGGGIRGLNDLIRLAEYGCDGALVATALHDGRLGNDEVTDAQRLERPFRATDTRHAARYRSPTR